MEQGELLGQFISCPHCKGTTLQQTCKNCGGTGIKFIPITDISTSEVWIVLTKVTRKEDNVLIINWNEGMFSNKFYTSEEIALAAITQSLNSNIHTIESNQFIFEYKPFKFTTIIKHNN